MTKQMVKLNSQAGGDKVSKDKSKQIKKALTDAYTVQELAAVIVGSRTNVSVVVGASIALNDLDERLTDQFKANLVREVKSVLPTLHNPQAAYNAILNSPKVRDLLLNVYGRGIYHEEAINDIVESINAACQENPKLKEAVDEQVAIYRKQLEEAEKNNQAENLHERK